MNMQRMLSVSGLAAVALLATPAIAQALNFPPPPTFTALPTFTDTDYTSLVNSGAFTELAVAESRFGDRGGQATYERAILPGSNSLPARQGQFDWQNGQTYDFTLKRRGNKIVYIVGGRRLQFKVDFGPIDTLYFRTNAESGDAVFLNSLQFNGSPVPFNGFSVNSDANGVAGIDWWLLSGIGGRNFTLTGQQTFNWAQDLDLPIESRLAYQIRVGRVIPTPALLPGLVGFGVAAMRKRRTAQEKAQA